VDLDLSDDQELFQETTNKFLGATWPTTTVRQWMEDPVGFDRDVWAQGAELGWTSLLVPEELGGGSISGQGVCDLAIVIEELGRALFAGPVLPTNLVAFALANGGSEELANRHLPEIVAGREIAAWATAEENDRWMAEGGSVTATTTKDGFRLNGVKSPVQDAHVADQLLVSTRDAEGVTQFLVPTDAPGVVVETLESLDLTRRFCRVRLDGVEVPRDAVVGTPQRGDAALEQQFGLAVALQCAETVGATDAIFDITVQYTKDRKAFGRPIGSYQALKHRMADMLLWLESSKAITDAAVKAVQFEVDAAHSASRAKVYVAEHCPVIVRECLQLHGGIGFTWEHDIHLYLRRVETNRAILGGADYHRDRLAPAVGL
jgi:alkylation response protein AidB-like acyl-CoA dehydrogenase